MTRESPISPFLAIIVGYRCRQTHTSSTIYVKIALAYPIRTFCFVDALYRQRVRRLIGHVMKMKGYSVALVMSYMSI